MTLLHKLTLCYRILRERPSNLIRHAQAELPPPDGDEMQAEMNRGLIELLTVFGTHGHSGFSAGYAVAALAKLLRFEPLGPLTGADDEWVTHEWAPTVQQNRRCSRVFRDANGDAYDIEGRVFVEPSGCSYTNSESRVPVTFPYVPHTEYVDVPEGAAA